MYYKPFLTFALVFLLLINADAFGQKFLGGIQLIPSLSITNGDLPSVVAETPNNNFSYTISGLVGYRFSNNFSVVFASGFQQSEYKLSVSGNYIGNLNPTAGSKYGNMLNNYWIVGVNTSYSTYYMDYSLGYQFNHYLSTNPNNGYYYKLSYFNDVHSISLKCARIFYWIKGIQTKLGTQILVPAKSFVSYTEGTKLSGYYLGFLIEFTKVW